MVTREQRDRLLALAHQAIVAAVTRTALSDPMAELRLPDIAGVFVTVRRRGELRGCLGTFGERLCLADAVRRCAMEAATVDARFSPVGAHELADLSVEISLLGPLEPIAPAPDAFVIGLHGLVVEASGRRGLLLPQVAVEWGWTPEEFLCRTTIKAGLPPQTWRRGARVYRFAAEVFGS